MIEQELQKIDDIMDACGNERQNLLHILQDANHEYGYLPEEVLRRVSGKIGISFAEIYSVATFFKSFRLTPRGLHLVTVCMGTACHVRGDLGICRSETTEDGRFTLETVNCVGACALGPIVVVDGNYHGQMNMNQVESLLQEYD